MPDLQSIDLNIARRLRDDTDFRREWFRAELEASVPEQFRILREARGLTQSQLAEAAGSANGLAMKQSAISRFERSTTPNWSLATLLRLAEALNARISITLTPAELVIAQYEAEEARGARDACLSVGTQVTALLPIQKEPGRRIPESPQAPDQTARSYLGDKYGTQNDRLQPRGASYIGDPREGTSIPA